jgi:predicted nucleic acid-binding protein
VDKSGQEKHERATKFFEKIMGPDVFVSVQCLREFAFICLKKKFISSETVTEFVDLFSANFIVLQDDFFDTKQAIELCKDNANLFWDANIVSVMKRNNVECIYTENTRDFSILGVKAINPLE